MSRPIVLTMVGYYLPGFKSGGPIRTIANMVAALGDELDFRIVTADRDFRDTAPYAGITQNCWMPVGKAQVYYAAPERRAPGAIARIMRETPHDVLYLNSFFHPNFTIYPLLARWLRRTPRRPVVIAPRGEFSGGAWRKSHTKKVAYTLAARAAGLYGGVTWQASSDYEAADIQRIMGAAPETIAVVPDLPAPVDVSTVEAWHARRDPGAPFRVCFIARIVPWKNLDFAIRALAGVRAPLEFNVYGLTPDAEYWQKCEALMAELPATITAHYHGPLAHEHVPEMLAGQDLLLFPTMGENFGHIIYEALASGLPVLISDKTPWRDLEAEGVGWDLPLDDTGRFTDVIESQAALAPDARVAQRRAALGYAARVASDAAVLENNLNLFTQNAGAGVVSHAR